MCVDPLAIVTTISTVVIAVFSWLVWRVYAKIAWFTGAMETHSEIMMRLAAKEKGVEMVWWDPTIGKIPVTKEHNQPVNTDKIYLYLPLALRKNKNKL